MTQAERAVRNEATFRDLNEKIKQAGERFDVRVGDFACECSNPDCSELISIPYEEYERVRARGARFAMIAGHEDLAVERIVEEHDDYVVVEKTGEDATIAEGLDPRD